MSNPCRSLTVKTETGVFTGGDRIIHAGLPFGVQKEVELRPLQSRFEVAGATPAKYGVLPLSNFGAVDFSNGSTIKDGQTVTIAGAGADPITMLSGNNQPLAVPTALSADGSSFKVARTDAPSTTAGQAHRPARNQPPSYSHSIRRPTRVRRESPAPRRKARH